MLAIIPTDKLEKLYGHTTDTVKELSINIVINQNTSFINQLSRATKVCNLTSLPKSTLLGLIKVIVDTHTVTKRNQ